MYYYEYVGRKTGPPIYYVSIFITKHYKGGSSTYGGKSTLGSWVRQRRVSIVLQVITDAIQDISHLREPGLPRDLGIIQSNKGKMKDESYGMGGCCHRANHCLSRASLFVTVINEYVARMLNLRGRQLCNALKQLIDDEGTRQILMKSPALRPFFDNQPGKATSYVDPNVLGRLLVGSLAAAGTADTMVNQVSRAIDNLADSALKTQLQAIVRTAENTPGGLVTAVSEWVDRSLTMLGEGYRRKLQIITFGVGLSVTVALNINTVTLTEHLYRDKEAREAAGALALQITEKTSKEAFDKCMVISPEERRTDAACAPLVGLVDAIQGHINPWANCPSVGRKPRPNRREHRTLILLMPGFP